MGARNLTVHPTLGSRHLAFAAALAWLAMTTGCLAQAESQAADQEEKVGQFGSALNVGEEAIVVAAPPAGGTDPAGGGTDNENGPEPDPWHARTLNAGGPEPDPWHPTGGAAASGASGTSQGTNGKN